jgi:hypothetical protein
VNEQNPYASPRSRLTHNPHDVGSVERDRLEHRAQEGHVRLFAVALGVHGAMRLGFAGLMGLSTLPELSTMGGEVWVLLGTYGFMAALALPKLIAAYGMHQLRPWGRWVGIGAAALGLLAMPIGTAVGIWGLIVLLMPKAQRVFSPDYAEVRRRTPGVPWKGLPVAIGVIAAVGISTVVLSIAACVGLVAMAP